MYIFSYLHISARARVMFINKDDEDLLIFVYTQSLVNLILFADFYLSVN